MRKMLILLMVCSVCLLVILMPEFLVNATETELVNEPFDNMTTITSSGWSNASFSLVSPGYGGSGNAIQAQTAAGSYIYKNIGSTITDGTVIFETYYKNDPTNTSNRYIFTWWPSGTFNQSLAFYPLKMDASNKLTLYNESGASYILKSVDDYNWHKYKLIVKLTSGTSAKIDVLGVYVDDQLCSGDYAFPRSVTNSSLAYREIGYVGTRTYGGTPASVDNFKVLRIDDSGSLTTPSITNDSKYLQVAIDFGSIMDSSTLTSTQIIVKKGSTTVTPSILYGGSKISLQLLEPGTQYNITVKGGALGVKDIFGNALASDATFVVTTGKYLYDDNFDSLTSWPLSWTRTSATVADFTATNGYSQGGLITNNSGGVSAYTRIEEIRNGIVVFEVDYKKDNTAGPAYPVGWWPSGASGNGCFPFYLDASNNVLISNTSSTKVGTVDTGWHHYKVVLRLTYVDNGNASNNCEVLGLFVDGKFCGAAGAPYPISLNSTVARSAYNGIRYVGFRTWGSVAVGEDNYKVYSYDIANLASVPANNSVNVYVDGNVAIPYDGIIDNTTVNSSNVSVYAGSVSSANKLNAADYTAACSATSQDTIDVTFTGSLKFNTDYYVVAANNVLDVKGTSIGRQVKFTTVPFSSLNVQYKLYEVGETQNETEISNLKEGNMRAKVTFNNNFAKAVPSGMIIFALYEKGTNKLVDLIGVDNQSLIANNSTAVTGDFSLGANFSNYKISVLLWDSLQSMKPNMVKYEFN